MIVPFTPDIPDHRCNKSRFERNGGRDRVCDNVLFVTSSTPGDCGVSFRILVLRFLSRIAYFTPSVL